MGNIIKDNPVGLDVWIQKMQTAIYDKFFVDWNLSEGDWNSYGRLYRNFDNEGKEYLPYPFLLNNEYENPVLFNDNIKIQTFFDILEDIKITDCCQSSAKVVFYCFCDLVKLFGSTGDREDETIMQQIDSFVQEYFGFHLHSKRVGIKTVMKDWSGYAKVSTMEADMQPNFAFSLEFEINEYYTCYGFNINYTQPDTLLIPYTRFSPKGIDEWIQNCQIYLFNYILGVFNGGNSGYGTISTNDYNCFGRCYRNSSNKQYIPQAFVKIVGGGFEYVNIFCEDTVSLQTFFDVGETMRESTNDLFAYANIHLYIFCDLSKLYPDAITRMDEEFIILMLRFMMEQSGFDEVYNVSRGVKSIFNEYNGIKVIKTQKQNLQPFLWFRIDCKKYYDESFNNCPILIPNERQHEFAPQEFDPNEFA